MMSAPQMQRLTKEQYPMMWSGDANTFHANGDYQWMSQQIGNGSVLEIGCGIGLSTSLLAKRGPLMSVDHNHNCIETAEKLLTDAGIPVHRITEAAPASLANAVSFLEGDVFNLLPWQKQAIEDFSPKWVVCWLIGSYSEAVQQRSPSEPLHEAIAFYREELEVALATLATSLPSVQGIQFVHRIQMPWNKKDEGRIETAKTFNEYVFSGTSFTATRESVLFRKWQIRNQESGIVYGSRDSIEGAIPCLVSVFGTK